LRKLCFGSTRTPHFEITTTPLAFFSAAKPG
jgi:hypothetical protein